MVYAFEFIGLIFVAIMVYLTYLEYKKGRIAKFGMVFWNLIWLVGIFLIIFHSNINSILPTLNIVRALDLYMILAFMFLFGVIFYLYLIIKNTEKRVEEITRAVALKPIKVMKKGR